MLFCQLRFPSDFETEQVSGPKNVAFNCSITVPHDCSVSACLAMHLYYASSHLLTAGIDCPWHVRACPWHLSIPLLTFEQLVFPILVTLLDGYCFAFPQLIPGDELDQELWTAGRLMAVLWAEASVVQVCVFSSASRTIDSYMYLWIEKPLEYGFDLTRVLWLIPLLFCSLWTLCPNIVNQQIFLGVGARSWSIS